MAGQADHMDDELEHEDDGRCGPQKRAATRSSRAISSTFGRRPRCGQQVFATRSAEPLAARKARAKELKPHARPQCVVVFKSIPKVAWLQKRNEVFAAPPTLAVARAVGTGSQPWNERTQTHWLVRHQSSFPALPIGELHVLIPPSVAWPLAQKGIVRYT